MAGRKENGAEFHMPIKAVPYHHQMEAFRFACGLFGILPGEGKEAGSRDAPSRLQSSGAALLMEMGTGKTLTTIGITGALSNAGRIRRVLVVAPLSILGVWEEEFQKFADFPYCLVVLSGNGSRKRDTLWHMAGASLQVAVVNYESAWRMEKDLGAWRPDLIVADEGHKIKTHNISASRAMHRLGAKAGYRLLLTGTVITNKAVDVFSQYKFVNPAIFGQSFYAFRGRYFDMVGYGNHTPVLKKSMEAELMDRMHSIAFRATKAECLDLPEMTDILRQVELESAALQIYRGLVKESYAELSGGEVTATNILTRLLRLSQLTGGFIGNDVTSAVEQVSCAKLSALEDILDGIMAEGKKLVIIARFIPEIKAICRLLGKRKLRYDFSETERTRAELERYRIESNSVLSFAKMYCERREDGCVVRDDLFLRYKEYCGKGCRAARRKDGGIVAVYLLSAVLYLYHATAGRKAAMEKMAV